MTIWKTVLYLKDIQQQNEIFECVLQIYKNIVIAQVSKAPFIAIIADETTQELFKGFDSIINNQDRFGVSTIVKL